MQSDVRHDLFTIRITGPGFDLYTMFSNTLDRFTVFRRIDSKGDQTGTITIDGEG